MAQVTVDGLDGMMEAVEKLGSRSTTERLLRKGAEAATKVMKDETQTYRHVRTGEMMRKVGPGEYHFDITDSYVNVYPQGSDSRGVSNALKAYVINYGIGKRPNTRRSHGKERNKTGDKFITGNEELTETAVHAAMEQEMDRIADEINER